MYFLFRSRLSRHVHVYTVLPHVHVHTCVVEPRRKVLNMYMSHTALYSRPTCSFVCILCAVMTIKRTSVWRTAQSVSRLQYSRYADRGKGRSPCLVNSGFTGCGAPRRSNSLSHDRSFFTRQCSICLDPVWWLGIERLLLLLTGTLQMQNSLLLLSFLLSSWNHGLEVEPAYLPIINQCLHFFSKCKER